MDATTSAVLAATEADGNGLAGLVLIVAVQVALVVGVLRGARDRAAHQRRP